MSIRRRGIGRLARRNAERRFGVFGCITVIWSRDATCAVAETDCISFSRGDSACADFFCCAWSCNAKMVCPTLSLQCIRESRFPAAYELLLHFSRRDFFFLGVAAFFFSQSE